MRFERNEAFLLSVLFMMAVLCVCLAASKQVIVAVSDYQFRSSIAIGALAIGQFFRIVRVMPTIAAPATAIGIFLIAGQVMRLFNYLLLPYQFESIDAALASIDASFGYVWSEFANRMSQYRWATGILRNVYISSYAQILLLITLLGVCKKTTAISRFLCANIFGGIITICIWFLFPSSTPSAFQDISDDTAARLNLVLSTEYGEWLARSGQEGLSIINPSALGGIVGFPSFHTVMAVLVVWHARELRFAFPGFLALNILMVPAILLHGAHSLMDVFGGLAVAALAIWLARENHARASASHPENALSKVRQWDLLPTRR